MRAVNKDDLSLSDRKKRILRFIVESYISNGEPVGSQYLLDASDLTCSSATIRSEMAELEKMGYIEHLHTSSGRVPTQAGYKFYVESLMDKYKLTAMEIVELNNMLKSKFQELDSMLNAAAKFVSSVTNYTTLALKSGDKVDSITKFSYMKLDDYSFLLIMKLSNDKVTTKQISTEEYVDDYVLKRLCDILNNTISGVQSKNITLPMMMNMKKEMGMNDELITKSIEAVYDLLGNENDTEIQFDGVKNLLDYPEFADVQKIKDVMGLIEKKDDLIKIMSDDEGDGVNIKLGNESQGLVDDSALIYRTINVGGKTVGAIGVLGPARMDYSKVISTVEYMTEKISDILSSALPPGKKNEDVEENNE